MNRIKSLLITGSNGFVGQSFLNYLCNLPTDLLPNELVLVNRNPAKIPKSNNVAKCKINFILADLTKPWEFDQEISHVLNLAGDGSANAYSEESAKNFIKICQNLKIWSKKNYPKVIVHASSGACFYNSKNDTTFNNKKFLIESRVQGEALVNEISKDSGTKTLSARLFTFIGPNIINKTQYAASSFISNALENKFIKVFGNPNTIRSYMHESTMSEWLYKCLINENPAGIVSVGSSIPVTIQELVEYVALKTNSKVEYKNLDSEPNVYIPTVDYEIDYLGVNQGPTWKDSIDECIKIYRESR